MYLQQLSLQNFRSYSKVQFTLNSSLTIIVGPNASGKTNLVEAIGILSTGKSFRTSKEKQLIAFGETVARVKGQSVSIVGTHASSTHSALDINESDDIEVVLADTHTNFLQKRYLINGVSKRRASLAGMLPSVRFTPLDLALVLGQPGDKRRFLDEVLEQIDPQYTSALLTYGKALRQRNALLEFVQKSGHRDEERFAYWDNLLITNGQILTEKREAFIEYINQLEKPLFHFTLTYDSSLMSRERLLQYKDAEVGAGVTLVGPQRDDIIMQSRHPYSKEFEDVKYFCSRGQQRLITLELKKSQLSYIQKHLEIQPLLVLDDIFSELDSEHINHVLQLSHDFQTIITTTHKEFIANIGLREMKMIELEEK